MSDPRKHFEAVIADLALRLKREPRDIRADVKQALMAKGRIVWSTTELGETELEQYADKLHVYVFHCDEYPRDEWKPFDLNTVLFS